MQKHVAIVSVTGKEFKTQKIPLKSVRPFVTREIILAQDKRFKGLDKKKDNRQEVTRRLMEVVEEMIEAANAEWEAIQTDEEALEERPLPLIRLKVEYTAPEGGVFECENPQRFSNRFVGKVANTNDVVSFYRKKTAQRKPAGAATVHADVLENLADSSDMVKVDSLVQDFLSAQSLKVLPQGPFGDAVNQFVAKDDKHAMELFVSEHLSGQVKQMLGLESDDEDFNSAMDIYRARVEQQIAAGENRVLGDRQRVLRPKPATWDSDFDGNWEDEPDAWTYAPVSQPSLTGGDVTGSRSQARADEDDEPPAPAKSTRRTATKTTKAPAKKAAPAKKTTARGARGRKAVDEEEKEEEDVVMESDEEPEPELPKRGTRGATSRAKAAPAPKKASTRASTRGKQSTLNFSQRSGTQTKGVEVSDDEISDEDDAFEPAPIATRTRRR